MAGKLGSRSVDIEQFMEGIVWQDFRCVAESRIDAIRSDIMKVNSMEELRLLQGEALGVEFWLRFPEQIKNLLAEEESKEKM